MLQKLAKTAILVVFLGCNNQIPAVVAPSILKNQHNDSLYILVGKKHDEIMPKDSDLERLIRDLRKQEWQQPKKDTALTLLGKLNEAHEEMMNWMHEFKSTELFEEDYKKMSESQIWDYLLQEEKRIEIVREKMLSSIKNAEQFYK